jgi:hypothetical protein
MANLREILEQNGITEIIASFSGSGDSGGIDEVDINTDGTLSKETEKAIEKAITDFASSEIYKAMGHYENNEGGGGTLTFKLDDDQWKSEIDAHYFYESSEINQDSDISLDNEQLQAIENLLGDHLKEVDKIRIQYYGSGDSGGIEDISFEQNMSNLKMDETLGSAASELSVFFDEIIDDYHPGFELDTGGSGDFTITLTNGKIDKVHLFASYNTLQKEYECHLSADSDINALLDKEIVIEKAKEKSKGAEL